MASLPDISDVEGGEGGRQQHLFWIAGVLALAGIYYGAAKLGLSMGFTEQVSAVWPPSGIALAAVLLCGYRMWPGIALGAFAANFTAANESLATAAGIAVGNTLEAVLGAWLLRQVRRFDPALERLRDVFAFIVLAAVLSTTISATIGVTSLCLGGVQPWEAYGSLWWVWWLGDTTGNLLFAPVLMVWAVRPGFRLTRRWAEAAALLVGLTSVSLLVFGGEWSPKMGDYSLKYTVFPFAIWAALRFGQHGTTAMTLVASSLAIWGTLHGSGPFSAVAENERLLSLQVFMGVIAITSLFLGAALTERRRASDELRQQREWLQVTLTSIGDAVIATDGRGRVTFLNPVAEALTGWRQDALGKRLAEVYQLVDEETGQALKSPVTGILQRGVVVRLPQRTLLRAKSGHTMAIDGSAAPICEPRGQIIGIVQVFRDVSEQRRDEQRIAVLHAVTRILAEAIPLPEAAAKILEAICTGLQWQVGGIWQVDPEGQVLRCIKVWQAAPAAFPDFEALSRRTAFVPGQGLPGRVWQNGQPAWIPDIATDGNFPRAASAAQEGLHAAFGFPIRLGTEVLGVIEFFSPEIRQPDDGLLRMLSTVGSQIGQFIERQQVEQRVRDSEERFRTTFTHAAVGIALTDNQGRFLHVNPAYCDITGYTEQELYEMDFYAITPPADVPGKRDLVRQLVDGEIPSFVIEKHYLTKSGGLVWVQNSVSLIRDRRGRPQYLALLTEDITERKQAVEALRDSEERSRSVVDHVVDGIITIDEHGTVESLNPAAERVFGYPAAEVLGQNVKMLMPEPYLHEHDSYLANYLRTGIAKIIGIGREVTGRRRDGSTFPMELAVSTFHLGRRRLFTGIVRDITARNRLEQELQRRVQELALADRRKDEFLALLAHELRNPLAPIRNGVEVMRVIGLPDPQLREVRDMLERQVDHISRLVDDLLDVSRVTRGKIRLQKEPTDLAAVVQHAIETCRPFIAKRGHELNMGLPATPLFVECDLIRLAQVIANLLNNAAKYSREGSRITLTAARAGNQAEVRVRDEGIGIAAEMLPRIFDLFAQADVSLGRSDGGLGIGLTLVRTLVEMHGGSVQAYSDGLEKGSEFVVRLPLVEAAPGPGRAPLLDGRPAGDWLHQAPACAKTWRILVVDDNQDSAKSLEVLLKLMGHSVTTAHDGPSALAAAAQHRPEVVLLDIGLPGMDGFEVARHLRRDLGLADILLVAMTGYGQEEDRRHSQESGFNAHLVKPVDLAALRNLLLNPKFADSLR